MVAPKQSRVSLGRVKRSALRAGAKTPVAGLPRSPAWSALEYPAFAVTRARTRVRGAPQPAGRPRSIGAEWVQYRRSSRAAPTHNARAHRARRADQVHRVDSEGATLASWMSLSSLGVRPALLPPAQPARSRTIAPLLPAPVASLPMWRCTLVRDERPSGTCTSTWFAMPPHALRRTVVRGPRVCTMSCLCLTNAGARVIRSRSAAEGQREVVEFKNRLRCANAKLHHTSIGFDSRKIHGVDVRAGRVRRARFPGLPSS